MEQGAKQILASLLECNKEVLNFKLDESLKSIENEVVTLKNISKEIVGIKIKTNAYKLYQVKPNIAILNPGDELKIEIVAHLKTEKEATIFKHKFLIQGITINKEISIKNLNSIFETENFSGLKQDIKLIVKNSLKQSSNIEDKSKSEMVEAKSSEKGNDEFPKNQTNKLKSEVINLSSSVPQSKMQVMENFNLSDQKPISEEKFLSSSNKKNDIELKNNYNKLLEDYKSLCSENLTYKEKLKNVESKNQDNSYTSPIKFNRDIEKWSTRTLLILIIISFLLGFIIRGKFS